jgi:serpin B
LALNYGAGGNRLNFSDSEGSRKTINDWVAEHTQERITDLLPKGSLDASTRFALVNAIYFNARGYAAFNPEATRDGTFHAPSGDVDAHMMLGGGTHYTYAEGDGYQALELSYVPVSLRMLIILPSEGRFDEVQAKFDRSTFSAVREQLHSELIALTLPRFTFDSKLELSSTLDALGMQRAFVAGPGPNSADFTAMADTKPPLYVSQVRHRTFIAVEESGVEAAGATAVVGGVGAIQHPPTPIEVTVDRPFLFVIYDKPTGQVLFVGRLLDPT